MINYNYIVTSRNLCYVIKRTQKIYRTIENQIEQKEETKMIHKIKCNEEEEEEKKEKLDTQMHDDTGFNQSQYNLYRVRIYTWYDS